MRHILAAILSVFLVIGIFFTAYRCVRSAPPAPRYTDEIRGIWLSYMDLAAPHNQYSKKEFEQKADQILRNIACLHINTVFFHARAFSDAFYDSDIFPTSSYLSGKQGAEIHFDPLDIFCRKAKPYGIQVHAWINPFRICADASKWEDVSAQNPAKRFLTDDITQNDTAVIRTAGGVYYNPASADAQALILQGVREILEHYPVQGIHIDDYFYPSQEERIDRFEYAAYLKAGGTMDLADWRRDTVNRWVQDMYKTVKSFGNDTIFSISPAVNMKMNREKLYADAAVWCREKGYCDWIIPQVYVGFAHTSMPFDKAAKEWNELTVNKDIRLLFGLAAYKSGQEDTYAGSGSREWMENTDILSRQISYARKNTGASGFVFYAYSSFFGEKANDFAKKELHFVTSVL